MRSLEKSDLCCVLLDAEVKKTSYKRAVSERIISDSVAATLAYDINSATLDGMKNQRLL